MTTNVPPSDRSKASRRQRTSRAQPVDIVPSPSRRLTVFTTLALGAWWLANMILVPAFSSDAIVSVDARISAEATAQGSVSRQALVVSFALLGALHWRRAWRVLQKSPRHRRLLSAVLIPFALYLAWAMLSTVWSVAPDLTIRRLVLLVLLVIGGMGLGAGFYGSTVGGLRLLARHVAVAGMIAMGFLWLPKLAGGDVNIFDPRWSLRSIAVGSVAAFPISLGALAALYVAFEDEPARSRDARRLAAILYVAFALLSLFALRKRVALTVFVIAIPSFVMASLGGSPRVRRLLALSVANLVALLFFLQVVIGFPVFEQVITVVIRESDPEQLSTLSSRVPLWDYLLTFVADRPLTGHGFGAFWNPEMIGEVQASVGWAATGGHSGFLDELLATGVVGLLLILSSLLYGAVLVFRLSTGQQRDFARLVIFWIGMLFALNLTTSIMQSYFKFPFYVVVIGLFAVAAWDDGPQRLAPVRRRRGSQGRPRFLTSARSGRDAPGGTRDG